MKTFETFEEAFLFQKELGYYGGFDLETGIENIDRIQWEEMCENDITYYPSLEVLLKADKGAEIIIKHKDVLNQVMPFLNI